MKKGQAAHLVNICIGACLLAYGLWMAYTLANKRYAEGL